MEEQLQGRTHKFMMTNRRSGNITGIKDVISFDLKEILVDTTQGILSIKGRDMHVKRLTLEKGEIDIEGQIISFTYKDIDDGQKNSESFFSKMFK